MSKKAKDLGYFIRLFFICTNSPSINVRRVEQRVLEGGHDVPISKIYARYTKSIINGSLASLIVDRAYFYDNSIDNYSPKLIFRTADGLIKKQYHEFNGWTANVKTILEVKN